VRDLRPDERETPPPRSDEFLPFRPWMLAAAVLLACALGVAVMERLTAPELWAQAAARSGR
jgi:hypothetical protein